MTALSIISAMPETKAQVKSFVQDAKDRILAGLENPLKIASQLKAFEEVIKELREDKEIKEVILNEFAKHGEKSIELFGTKFTQAETGVKYDYSQCDDALWTNLEKQISDLKAKQKDRETFLKAIHGDVFDDNGIKLNPPAKTSTTNVNVTLL